MGGDKRFKARWTDNFGVGTTNVNKSLPTPLDFSGTLNNILLHTIYRYGRTNI